MAPYCSPSYYPRSLPPRNKPDAENKKANRVRLASLLERTGSAVGVALFRLTFHPVSNRDCRLFSLAMLFEGLWWVVQVSNL